MQSAEPNIYDESRCNVAKTARQKDLKHMN